MLARVRINAPTALCVRADAALLPFEDRTFGAVVNLAALDLYADAARVVRESARVLAPGGRWIASSFVTQDGPARGQTGSPSRAEKGPVPPVRAALKRLWARAAGLHTPTEREIALYAERAGLVRFACQRFGRYVVAWADKP
jgi:ubiquinone/menaquinone biosynthesis C-methylase UbiE